MVYANRRHYNNNPLTRIRYRRSSYSRSEDACEILIGMHNIVCDLICLIEALFIPVRCIRGENINDDSYLCIKCLKWVVPLERKRLPCDTIVERSNSLDSGNTLFDLNTHKIFIQQKRYQLLLKGTHNHFTVITAGIYFYTFYFWWHNYKRTRLGLIFTAY